MRLGLDVAQHHLSWEEILARVRYAEETGFDGAGVFDHFQSLYGDPGGPCLEGWTLLAALAAATTRIRLGTLVTGMTHRHPSGLATEGVTGDPVSGGRRGGGGGRALRLRRSGGRVSFDGRHSRLDGALYRPKPVQTPHPPIWIGAKGM